MLRDPVWTFVGAIVTAVSILTIIGIFFAQRKKKSLTYEAPTNTQLIGVKDEVKDNIKILFNNEQVENVHLLEIRFINDGNIPILSADYEREVSISFDKTSTILSVEVTEEDPENLVVEYIVEDSKIIIKPLLLNPKDNFSIKILTSNYQDFPTIDARITGIKSVAKSTDGQARLLYSSVIGMIMIFAGIIYSEASASVISFLGIDLESKSIGMTTFFCGYGLLWVGTFRNKIFKRAMRRVVPGW